MESSSVPAPIRVFTLTNGGSNVVGQSKASESAANAPTDDISSETDHTSTEAFRIKSGEDETLYFKTIPEYLDDVVEKACPPPCAIRASTDIIIADIDKSGMPPKPGLPMSSSHHLPTAALREQLGCVPLDVNAIRNRTGNSTGFDGLVTCCLQANLPGLQERLVSSQSASQGTGDSKPLIGHCDEYGRNLLCLAVHGGSVKCCDYLVACGCEVDSPDTEGNTPLHYACCIGEHSLVKSLAKAGASAGRQNRKGCTPLHLAVASGNEKAVHALIKEARDVGTSVNVPNQARMTPLSLAVYYDLAAVVSQLLKAKVEMNVASTASHGYCPIHYCLHHVAKKTLKIMLDLPGSCKATTAAGLTALSLVAATGNIPHAELLLKKGSQAEQQDMLGCTALHWAALYGQTTFLGFLLEWKKGVLQSCLAIKDANGASPLHYAALQGHTSAIRFLLAKGCLAEDADVNSRLASHYGALGLNSLEVLRELFNSKPDLVRCLDKEGYSCLHLAALTSKADLLKWLVTTYALELNVQTKQLRSCLWLASRHGHDECVQWLTSHGADVHLPDCRKMSPLHAASQHGHLAVVECLLGCGAELTSTTEDGEMSLHLASASGHAPVVSLLLSKGSAVDAVCRLGRTALSLAAESGHAAACRALVENGAEVNKTDSSTEHLSPLDYALRHSHRECADYIVSVGGFTSGGRFHRAVAMLQAVWKFKTNCRQKKVAREHAARVIQNAATELLRKRVAKKDDKIEKSRRNRAARVIQAAWRNYVSEKHRYEASYKRLKGMLAREKKQAFLSLETLQTKTADAVMTPPTTISLMGRKRLMTFAPQRVPTLDSKEHEALVDSLTNISTALGDGATAEGKGTAGRKDKNFETVDGVQTGSPMAASLMRSRKGGTKPAATDVAPKQLQIAVKKSTKDKIGAKASKRHLAPVAAKHQVSVGCKSPHKQPTATHRSLPNTLETIQQLEDSIAHRDAEIRRLREENQRLLLKEKEERLASTRLPTIHVKSLPAGGKHRPRALASVPGNPQSHVLAMYRNGVSCDVAPRRVADVDDLDLQYHTRSDELRSLLQSVQGKSMECARPKSRNILLDNASPRPSKHGNRNADTLESALHEAKQLQSDSERLATKVFSRAGRQQS